MSKNPNSESSLERPTLLGENESPNRGRPKRPRRLSDSPSRAPNLSSRPSEPKSGHRRIDTVLSDVDAISSPGPSDRDGDRNPKHDGRRGRTGKLSPDPDGRKLSPIVESNVIRQERLSQRRSGPPSRSPGVRQALKTGKESRIEEVDEQAIADSTSDTGDSQHERNIGYRRRSSLPNNKKMYHNRINAETGKNGDLEGIEALQQVLNSDRLTRDDIASSEKSCGTAAASAVTEHLTSDGKDAKHVDG